MMTPEEHFNSLARVVEKAAKDNESLRRELAEAQALAEHLKQQVTTLTEALIEAVLACEACEGAGSYYVGGKIRRHVVCARCQKCRMVLAAARGETR